MIKNAQTKTEVETETETETVSARPITAGEGEEKREEGAVVGTVGSGLGRV